MDYNKVITDLESGELDRNRVTLLFDNDGGYWNWDVTEEEYETEKNKYQKDLEEAKKQWPKDFESDDDVEDFIINCINDDRCKKLDKKYGRPDGYADVVNIANAAGIPAEWC